MKNHYNIIVIRGVQILCSFFFLFFVYFLFFLLKSLVYKKILKPREIQKQRQIQKLKRFKDLKLKRFFFFFVHLFSFYKAKKIKEITITQTSKGYKLDVPRGKKMLTIHEIENLQSDLTAFIMDYYVTQADKKLQRDLKRGKGRK